MWRISSASPWTGTEGVTDWMETRYTTIVTDKSTNIDLLEATRSKRCDNQLHIWSAPNYLIDLRCQFISLIYQVSFSRGRSESFRQRDYPRRECCLLDFMSDTISIRILYKWNCSYAIVALDYSTPEHSHSLNRLNEGYMIPTWHSHFVVSYSL